MKTLIALLLLAGAAVAQQPNAAVRRWMRSLSLRQKVAQLVVLPFYGESPSSRSPEFQKYVRWVRTLRVGGLVVVNRVQNGSVRHAQPYAMAAFLNRMQKLARIPLLVAGDFERGASMRVESENKFPHNMAFAATGDPGLSHYEGEVTAREARALGVQWVLVPVADVNNNPDNPIINIRSYGENPETVAEHVAAFLDGARADGKMRVLTAVKHFPGHGDTATDTHLGLATLPVDRDRLDRVELVPFRAAIRKGVDAVMTAHIALPLLGEPELPATLSPVALDGLLRKELGFRGLIVTDALDMKGISQQWPSGEAAVRALAAGADVLLMPERPEEAIEGVVRAVKHGRLTEKRINESVQKMLAAKVSVGLPKRRLVDLESVADEMGSPETSARVQEIADRAVTLVRNEDAVVPLRDPASAPCFLILAESRFSTQGRAFQDEVRKRLPNARLTLLDPLVPDTEIEQVAASMGGCDSVVVAAFASVTSYWSGGALSGGYPKLLGLLQAGGRRIILIALGNPYLIRGFPGVAAYLTTYSPALPCEAAAVKALFGEIAIQGRLPVSIPGIAAYGGGIQLPARGGRSEL